MLPFTVRRLLLVVPMLIGASLLIFTIFNISTVDPVKRYLGDRANDEELVSRLRGELGLDDPAWKRYLRFIGGVAVGDFGKSISTRRPVTEEIKRRFPASLELAATALLLSVGFGLAAGVAAGLRRNTPVDYLAMGAALLAVSLPVFWLALLLSWFFAERLGWLPLDQRLGLRFIGRVEPRTGLMLVDSALAGDWVVFRESLRHLVLPAVTLAMVTSAFVARMTRSSVLEVLRQDYVRTATAKGLGPVGRLHHILRNALIPVVTIIGLEVPALIGGAVITETIFTWPGLGSYLIDSILAADTPAVQGVVMFTTLLFILTNLVVDLLCAAIDPRVREGQLAAA